MPRRACAWSVFRSLRSCYAHTLNAEYRGSKMSSARKIRSAAVAVLLTTIGAGTLAVAQQPARTAPTAADWAALAKLPDFTGVWEIGFGGPAGRGAGGGRGAGAGGGPAGPQLE